MQIARNSETPIEEGMLIGGKRVNGAYKIEIFNPARPDDLVGTVVRGTTDHVDAAVRSAKSAQPTWAAMTYVQSGCPASGSESSGKRHRSPCHGVREGERQAACASAWRSSQCAEATKTGS